MNKGEYYYAISRDFLDVRLIAQSVDPPVTLMAVVLRLVLLVLVRHPANRQECAAKTAEARVDPPYYLLL